MQRTDFLNEIFDFFRCQKSDSTFRAYDMALTVNYQVDWVRFYSDTIKNAEKRVLPMPKYFIENIRHYKIEPEARSVLEGRLLRVELTDGRYYDFTVCSFANTSLNNVKAKFKDDLKRVTLYNEGITALEVDMNRVKESDYKIIYE